jgi:hypothetical protein
MAVSKVSICNQALSKIKIDSIMALTENSRQARECNLLFEDTLSEALTMRAWNFATTRVNLAQLVTAPLSVYTYKYQLPVDCLQVLEVIDTSSNLSGYKIEYKIEGRELLCDCAACQIMYIKNVTDMSELSPLFRAYLTTRLAYELSFPLNSILTLKDRLEKEMMMRLSDAKISDGMEISPKMKVTSTVIDVRYIRGRRGGRL